MIFSGCFLKGYQVQTSFIFQNGAKGELALVDTHLLFALTDVPGLPGELRYFASQWVEAAAKCSGFTMAGGYIDDPLVTVSAVETACAAAWIRGQVEARRLGEFKVSFVANDPNLPF